MSLKSGPFQSGRSETTPRLGSKRSFRSRGAWRRKTYSEEPEEDAIEAKKREQRAQRFSSTASKGVTEPQKPASNESYGFVSRGQETRLQFNELAQRRFFDHILETFQDSSKLETKQGGSKSVPAHVLTDLRKLREAFLSREPDSFTKKVMLFSTRVSATVGHYQTYLPSIAYLLERARDLLEEAEHREIVLILCLHMAHCNNQDSRAIETYLEHLPQVQNSRVFKTLLAWALPDYFSWIQIYNTESDHSFYAVMAMGLPRVMKHMLESFTASFFSYSVKDFEGLLPKGLSLPNFLESYGEKWVRTDDMLVIRERHQRQKAESAKKRD